MNYETIEGMNPRYCFILLISLISISSFAQWQFESESTLDGTYRYYKSDSSQLNHIREAFLENRSGFNFKKDGFKAEVKALVRVLESRTNKEPNDISYVDLTPPRRLVRAFARSNSDHSSQQSVIDIGNAWFSYDFENFQFTAGRRALGIGVLRIMPVWNRLYPVLPTMSGYMLTNNPDFIDLRWNKNNWTLATYHIVSMYYDDSISAIEAIHYGDAIENHFLASKWWNQPVIGYTGALDSQLGMLRTEVLAIGTVNKNKRDGIQIGLGWERAINENFSALIEYYHSSFGTVNRNNYLLQDPTPFRTLLSTDYIYPQLITKITDFFTTKMGLIINVIDKSSMIIADGNYSISDNLELTSVLKLPTGGSKQEFGHLVVPVINQNLEYVSWVSLGLKYTF